MLACHPECNEGSHTQGPRSFVALRMTPEDQLVSPRLTFGSGIVLDSMHAALAPTANNLHFHFFPEEIREDLFDGGFANFGNVVGHSNRGLVKLQKFVKI